MKVAADQEYAQEIQKIQKLYGKKKSVKKKKKYQMWESISNGSNIESEDKNETVSQQRKI